MSKKKIDMTGYDNIPDFGGCCPDCPDCGATMGYSYIQSEFKCPDCGYIMDEDDRDYEDIYNDPDHPPYGCAACGGPWPHCQTSCKIFDD